MSSNAARLLRFTSHTQFVAEDSGKGPVYSLINEYLDFIGRLGKKDEFKEGAGLYMCVGKCIRSGW